MMKAVAYLLLIIIHLSAASTAAQNKVTLSGKVTDQQGLPVAQATVAAQGTGSGAYTDQGGRYSLQLAPGKYTLVVSFLGYRSVKQTLDLRQNQRLDFTLHEDAVALNAVEVYGKTHAQRVKEGAFAVDALDIKPIVNSLNNLNSLVNRSTGIKVREEGGVGSDFDLYINGMSGNSIRYFLDGMPLDTKGSGVSLANLPVNIIDRIEIYRGVVPASLSTDALGGAIHIITKQEKKHFLDASYSVGSFHTHRADLNAQFVERKTGLIIRPTLGLNYSKNDYRMKNVEVRNESKDKFIVGNPKRFHDAYFSLWGQVEVGTTGKPWADEFFVSASYSKTDKELQTGSVQSRVYGMAERKSDAWNMVARYRKQHFILKNMRLNASLSYTWDHSLTVDTAYRKYYWDGGYIISQRNEIMGRKPSMRHYKRPLTVLRANLDYRPNIHHNFNLSYHLSRTGNDRYDEMDKDFIPANDVVTKHIIALSYTQSLLDGRMNNVFFVKDYINHPNIRQTDQPSITGSKKVQGSTTHNYTGYGAGVKYTIVEPLSVKASYEHSVRLPIARELLGNGTTIYANVALEPESSNNLNAALFGTWHPAAGHTLYYEAGAFLRNVNNYIQTTITEKEGTMQYTNVSAVHIKGAEAEVRYDWQSRLQFSANVSYQDARDQQRLKADGKPSATYKNRVPNRPWLFGSAEAAYTFSNVALPQSRLRLSCTYQWAHWYFLTWEAYGSRENKARIPTQHICNADVTYSWKGGRYNIALECSNFLDRTAYDNYKLQKPGRAFMAKFRLFIE